MHARHARIALGSCGNAADPHECRHGGYARAFEQLAHICRRIREYNAAADKEQGAMCGKERLRRLPHGRHLVGDIACVSVQLDCLWIMVLDRRIKYVLCYVDDHDTGTSRPRDIECFLHDARDVVDIFHEIVVFRNRRGDADDIRLLKRVLSDVRIRDLSRNADHRYRVHMRCRNARHEIGCSGPRGRKCNADLARGSGIAVCRMRRALLMARQDVRKLHLVYFIVECEDGSPRIAEHDLNPLGLQALQESACTIHQQ